MFFVQIDIALPMVRKSTPFIQDIFTFFCYYFIWEMKTSEEKWREEIDLFINL